MIARGQVETLSVLALTGSMVGVKSLHGLLTLGGFAPASKGLKSACTSTSEPLDDLTTFFAVITPAYLRKRPLSPFGWTPSVPASDIAASDCCCSGAAAFDLHPIRDAAYDAQLTAECKAVETPEQESYFSIAGWSRARP